ncbi:MAG: copper homeostasis protein CutC [Crocinitomicaceae bacterium]|nr:copper homeostasis protein CutC [Crocinitomicaceae bacterium]
MKVELCAASIEAIQLAKKFNFSRIELCQNLEQGGITPSPGLIEYALAYGVETHVLIRPRPGGFKYNEDEIEIILRDIRECKAIGAQGVVIGALKEGGLINENAIALMMEQAQGMAVTFHRAFDDTFEFEQSLDSLIKLGVNRVLSSGLARNVDLGLPILTEMKSYAGNRIEIMPGGGVNASNIATIKKNVQPDAIHFSGTEKYLLDESSMFSETVLKVNEDKIQRLLNEII